MVDQKPRRTPTGVSSVGLGGEGGSERQDEQDTIKREQPSGNRTMRQHCVTVEEWFHSRRA